MTADVEFRKCVADVIAIIGRERARADEVESVVRAARQPDRTILWPPHPQTKADKRVARSIALALGRLEKKLGYADSEAVGYRATFTAQAEFAAWRAQITKWRRSFEAFAGILRADGPSFFPRDREGWPLGHKKKSTDKLMRKRKAVEAAARLLTSHGIELKGTRPSLGRRGSDFCRTAAVLYGNKREDLSYQCRVHIKKREVGK